MTDDPTPPREEPGDDAAQEAVRRLLADARHTAPMPADVAARLDAVLADLPRPEPDAVVVPIASRRRRRLATGLVAAAAVVVVGVALPNLAGGPGGSGGSGGSSDSAADSPAAGRAESGDQLLREESGAAEAAPQEDNTRPEAGPSDSAESLTAPATVSPDRFRRDALLARPKAVPSTAATVPVCGVPRAGAVVPVRYEDRDGYLVFGPPASSRQQVELYLCPEGELVRRAVIPAP